jgi:hypothetical protein
MTAFGSKIEELSTMFVCVLAGCRGGGGCPVDEEQSIDQWGGSLFFGKRKRQE